MAPHEQVRLLLAFPTLVHWAVVVAVGV